jgi:hypothetical protein
MYDFHNKLLPNSFENLWFTNESRRNFNNETERNLRDDNLLYVPFIRLEQLSKLPLAEFPKLWNEFSSVVVAPTRNLFKSLLKEHFMSKLSEQVLCNRLLCPTCHLRVATSE